MAPFEIRRSVLAALRKLIGRLMSPEWDQALEGETEGAVAAAALSLLRAQRIRLRLENAELATIRHELRRNEQALAAGRAALDEALEDLGGVRTVLEAATGFLGAVGRIIALPG